MKQNAIDCFLNEEEYPYEVCYYTAKQKNIKFRYFRSIEEIKEWCRRHKAARIYGASWQVFAVMKGFA